jgi:cold shock CspA family protein
MRGTMIWFNAEKGHGYISTEEEERLYVATDGFSDGEVPAGRCAGLSVVFDREHAGDEEARAVRVRFETTEPPRRARRRHRNA